MLSHYIAPLDAPLFCKLYKRYRGKTYAVALNILCNQHDAEDAAQSAWERVITHFPVARERWSDSRAVFEAWLVVIVSNIAKDELRKRKRFEAALERWCVRPGVEEETQDEYRTVVDAMDLMSDRNRVVLEYRLVYEYRFREVGRALGCGEDAARMRYNRAVEALRVRLEN